MSVTSVYEERLRKFQGIAEEEAATNRRLGWMRAIAFALALTFYVAMDLSPTSLRLPFGVAMGVAALAFLALVVRHRGVRKRRAQAETMAEINRRGVARTARNWKGLPHSPIRDPGREHPYARDLDLTGEGSLSHLLSTLTLPPGFARMGEWLFAGGSPEELVPRQQAVAELAEALELRQHLEAAGRSSEPPSQASMDAFLAWAESDPWLPGRRWTLIVARVLPLVTSVLLALFIFGKLETPWWLLSLGAGLAFASRFQLQIHPLMETASGGEEGFARYASVLDLILRSDVASPVLQELQSSVRSSPVGAVGELRALARIGGWADVRFSSMAHVPLQAFLVWDLHVLSKLEKWQARCGPHVRGWLEALGTFEALTALATLKADNPAWCFPKILEGQEEPEVRAEGMGHPLLPPARRVDNTLTVGPPETFVFVTGSNMSGKSTLLRALGANVVLALAGGPVCATSMSLPPLRVHTSMRTVDSLSEGLSQYMAELNRIRQVVEDARKGGSTPVLYLLDEPLQGTNEAERRIAVQTILGHLLRSGAIGAVATHDLQLDDSPSLEDAARAVHMAGAVQEKADGPLISFDYKVREGRATSTNALALLRAIGLGDEDGKGSAPSEKGFFHDD